MLTFDIIKLWKEGGDMLLELTNIAKIKKATISLDGITVIAGENNTGKSTIGKSLYCIFNAFYNSSEKLYMERKESIAQYIRRYMQRVLSVKNRTATLFISRQVSESMSEALLREGMVASQNELVELLITTTNQFPYPAYNNIPLELTNSIKENVEEYNSLFKQIGETLKISDDEIQQIIVSTYFSNEFDGQIQHLNHPDSLSKVTLSIKNRTISADFKKNNCRQIVENINIITEAIYIDTPFILDNIGRIGVHDKSHRSILLDKLSNNPNNNIVNEAISRKKLESVMDKITKVADGKFVKDDSGADSFIENGINKPIHLVNLSTGLKTFVIIKRLIENGSIKENGVLILDEPEIHLHPKWQLILAEVLVLLQKEFNLNILLNTHSPYFLSAIEVFSEKHAVLDKCKYYLSDADDAGESGVIITDVSGRTELIYKKLADPLQLLEDIRYGGN